MHIQILVIILVIMNKSIYQRFMDNNLQRFLKNLAKERRVLQKKISEKIRCEWTPSDTQLVQNIKANVQCLPELYNPETKDFLIIETDASDDTWAGCMKAIQNGKELLGLDIDGIPVLQSNLSKIQSIDGSQIPQSDQRLFKAELQSESVLKTEKYNSKLCKYISGTFSETEQKYSTHEKETLLCLKTLKWERLISYRQGLSYERTQNM